MPNVRFKRAITYIALGATTTLGSLVSSRAWAADGAPAGAPRAMSAPPVMVLTLPDLLTLPRTQAMAPLTLAFDATLFEQVRALATADAGNGVPSTVVSDHADAQAATEAPQTPTSLALNAPGRLAWRTRRALPSLALTLGEARDIQTAQVQAARPVVAPPIVEATERLAQQVQAPSASGLAQAPGVQSQAMPTQDGAFARTVALQPSAAEAFGLAEPTDIAAAMLAPPAQPLQSLASDAAKHGDVAALPVPAALVPQINFWKRVYTEVDSNHGFVHDAWHMDVIYSTIAVPAGSRRQSVRGISAQVSHVASILRNLAHGHREHPSEEEARVLAAWPKDVSNATLLEAARNVRFQTGQSDKFKAGLARARTWTPFIVSTFTAAGLPRELAALPHVESSFNMTAYSKVRAAGIWQFMPATARLFMHMDSTVDERLDPIRSTESAAHLLAQNYRLLGSWPLAITAYNHGPQGMHRAMNVTGSNNLAVIIGKYKTKHFGFASRNFYTELLAAWEVSQHPEQYFGQLPTEAPLQYETVTTDAFYHAKSISAALGIDLTVLRAHNPALRPVVWNNGRLIPRGFTMRVPRGLVHGDMLAMLGAIPTGERFAHADVGPARAVMIASHHPVAVARRHSARRFVAQRGRYATAARKDAASIRPDGAKQPLTGPLPWEQQQQAAKPATHSDAASPASTWLE